MNKNEKEKNKKIFSYLSEDEYYDFEWKHSTTPESSNIDDEDSKSYDEHSDGSNDSFNIVPTILDD